MSFINQMSSLRDSLNETKKKTGAAVRQTKRDARQLCQQAQELVQGFAKEQKTNAQMLRQELKDTTQRLESEVKGIRDENIKKGKERRREFKQAQAVFWGKQKKEEPRTT